MKIPTGTKQEIPKITKNNASLRVEKTTYQQTLPAATTTTKVRLTKYEYKHPCV